MTVYRNPGISPAFYSAMQDPEARLSILKEADIKTLEKTFYDEMGDTKDFDGIILRLEMSKNVIAAQGGSHIVQEQPVYYRAWIRIEGVHDKTLPNPCDFSNPKVQNYIIGLHSPPAISKMISPDQAARFNLKPGMIVSCEYNPGIGQDGIQRSFTFDPASAGRANQDKYPCLEKNVRLIKGGFATSPRRYFDQRKRDINDKIAANEAKANEDKRVMEAITGDDYIGKKELGGIDADPYPTKLYEMSLIAFYRFHSKLPSKKFVGMIDFTKAGKEPRMWVVDPSQKGWPIRAYCKVTHGSGSQPRGGPGGTPTVFTNTDRSHASSLGAMVVGTPYIDHTRDSLLAAKVIGLEGPCINDRVLGRLMIMHRAKYAETGGRSHGCWGIVPQISNSVIGALEGCLLYNFYDGNGEVMSTVSEADRCSDQDKADYQEKMDQIYSYYTRSKADDSQLSFDPSIFDDDGWLTIAAVAKYKLDTE